MVCIFLTKWFECIGGIILQMKITLYNKNMHIFIILYLISCRHDSHHREFLDLHLGDSNGGKEANLRGAHVGAFGQHTLPTLDVVTDRPVRR